MNMFEKASRLKLRFNTAKGAVSVEELWDIPLTSRNGFSVDEIAKDLNRQLKDGGEESFVVESSGPNEILQLGFDIVRHVIKVRLDEARIIATAKTLREKKQKIMSLIAKKEDEVLESEGIDKLREMLESL